jgi:hypothetical protein
MPRTSVKNLSEDSKKRMKRTARFYKAENKDDKVTKVVRRGRATMHQHMNNLLKENKNNLNTIVKNMKASYNPSELTKRYNELKQNNVNMNRTLNNLIKNLGLNKPKSNK